MKYQDWELPDDLRYHAEHCWLRSEGREAVIGWTDFACSLSEELTSVMVPEEGHRIERDKVMGTIESGKWVGKLYGPVSGEIVQVNEDVMDDPRLVNSDPYGEGWIMRFLMSDPSEMEALLDVQGYIGVMDGKLEELGL